MSQRKELSPRDREVVRRQALGQRSREIGETFGISASAVRMIWRKPEAKEYLAKLLEMMDIASGFAMKKLSLDAVKTLRDLLNQSDNLGIRLKAAKDVLDRTGIRAPD